MILAMLLIADVLFAANWPQFRGPDGSGIGNADLPVQFGPTTNVLWKTDIASGHSSPVIWNNRIFLTAFENDELQTLCLSRTDGKLLWRRAVKPTHIERSARDSHPATSTPCTDGQKIFAYFGSFGVIAYDFDGNEQWRVPLPVPITQHGASSSPVLAGNYVVLQRDADLDSHLLALEKSTGKIAWKTDRPDARRSFSTPLIMEREAAKSPCVVVAGTLRLATYDAKDGRELWTVRGLPNEMCSSPVFGDGLLFVAGWTHGSGVSAMPTFDALLERGDANKDEKLARAEAPAGPAKQHFLYIDANKDELMTRQEWDAMAEIFTKAENAGLAIRPDVKGDSTKPSVVWKQTRGLPYVATPLLYNHRIFYIKNGGLLSCFNATNGTPLYLEERIGALGDYFASPVAAGGKICVISRSGTATILETGDELKVLAKNNLAEAVLATPATVDNVLYVRTATKLYAFSAAQQPAH